MNWGSLSLTGVGATVGLTEEETSEQSLRGGEGRSPSRGAAHAKALGWDVVGAGGEGRVGGEGQGPGQAGPSK